MNRDLAINRSKLWFSLWLTVLILSGCATVGPDYVPPATDLSATWHTELKGGLNIDQKALQDLAAWWTLFNDPELSSLVNRAIAGNLDLKKARAKVREARAKRSVARADLFPTLNASGSATWSRSSGNSQSG